MVAGQWGPAGQGWEGQSVEPRLQGGSSATGCAAAPQAGRTAGGHGTRRDGQQRPSFATVDPRKRVWEYATLVTSLAAEIVTLGQLYRDRADWANHFDALKNQRGWGGFTTQDLKRSRLMARCVALMFNWWTPFARLTDIGRRASS
jgi:hypothetical protein